MPAALIRIDNCPQKSESKRGRRQNIANPAAQKRITPTERFTVGLNDTHTHHALANRLPLSLGEAVALISNICDCREQHPEHHSLSNSLRIIDHIRQQGSDIL